MSVEAVKTALAEVADPARALSHTRFFKTGAGEYGEGDLFIGVTVPEQRRVARRFRDLSLPDVHELVSSPVHEHRGTGFLILELAFGRARGEQRAAIFRFCREHLACVNNWDLVDLVAPKIIGPFLYDHPDERSMLVRLAGSTSVWERRVAIMATQPFIRHGRLDETLHLAERLLSDDHDLIHKAVGWMLRELGVRDRSRLDAFLDRHGARMPRTMLRYALEKHDPARRAHYMSRR